MKKDNLKYIHQYYNGELSLEELEGKISVSDFQQIKLFNTAFSGLNTTFNVESELEALTKSISTPVISKPKKSIPLYRRIASIAAVFVLVVSVGFFVSQQFYEDTSNVEYATLVGDDEKIILPDGSEVWINSKSELSFDKSSWKKERTLHLDGEAFFKVKKGSTFTVNTNVGSVEVLGTEFNVNTREQEINVNCFEGKVKVTPLNEVSSIITGGESYENQVVAKIDFEDNEPLWKSGKSKFDSESLKNVLEDLQLYYDVNFEFDDEIELSTNFTGEFSHDDSLETALKSIFDPLNLTFTKTKNRTFTISKK